MNSGNEGMEKLILAMNKIFDVCTQVNVDMQFDFPQIAVIGCQSAGKSSVLENFVGRDFLPRGSDIVTRRPLILQLITAKEEYGVFMHDKENELADFDDIRKEIEADTERVAGNQKGISNIPINLHIYSPNVLNLTLIDLPGMTKVPIGDQPSDIEHQIKDIILKYISKENCLILAVSPANSDLANSDALKLAKEVDPKGVRTIGVITKLDLMDEGTDAREILENKKLPLLRGYVGIVNRSQKDINEEKEISDALQAERDFFANHKSYRHLTDSMGTPHLQRVLNKQLTEHIQEKLPNLQDELQRIMDKTEKEVERYNSLQSSDPNTMKLIMQKTIRQMQSDFAKATGELGAKDIFINGLSNGAKICDMFHERLPNDISEITLDKSEMDSFIDTAVRNIYGYRPVLFEPYMVFEHLVKIEIQRMEKPVLKCIESVVGELMSAVRICIQDMPHYPNLREKIESNISSFVHGNMQRYKENTLALIQMELAYMNTKHDEFMKNLPSKEDEDDEQGSGSNANAQCQKEKANPTVDDMYENVDSYVRIVKKTICNMVPKAITLYVIKELEEYINNTIPVEFSGLSKDEYKDLFALNPEEEKRHQKSAKTYEACKKALEIIRNVSKEIVHGVITSPEKKPSRFSSRFIPSIFNNPLGI